jgi:hypothetical protein
LITPVLVFVQPPLLPPAPPVPVFAPPAPVFVPPVPVFVPPVPVFVPPVPPLVPPTPVCDPPAPVTVPPVPVVHEVAHVPFGHCILPGPQTLAPLQFWSERQVVPQPPQLVGSELKSAQLLPHMCVVAEQPDDEQVPLLHTCVPEHA